MYEFIYETWTLEQREAYLSRIGYEGDRSLTKHTLDELIYLHQCSVPFEDLDVFAGAETLALDAETLYEKIVLSRRGGFCFELNGAFVLLLRSLGFDAYSCMCRVAANRTVLGPLSHRATLVRLDGRYYLCDVGLGGPMAPFAVEVSPRRQTVRGETYWVESTFENWYLQQRLNEEGEESSVVIFALQPFLPDDFSAQCQALLDNPKSTFRTHRIVNLRTAEGHVGIRDNILTIRDKHGKQQLEFTEKEFPELLRKWFRLDYK